MMSIPRPTTSTPAPKPTPKPAVVSPIQMSKPTPKDIEEVKIAPQPDDEVQEEVPAIALVAPSFLTHPHIEAEDTPPWDVLGEETQVEEPTVETPAVNIKINTAPVPSARNEIDKVNTSEALKERYDKLFQDGYLVNVHVSVWGMSANLSESDLKIEKVSKFIKLGKKMLIDPEHLNVFKNMESKARRYLYRNSYDFPISDAHFVPKKRLGEVLTKLEEFKAEFTKLVNEFIENFDTYKDEVLEHDDYADIKEVLKPLYPTKAELRTKFGFSVSVFELAMPRAFEETDIQKLIDRDEAKDEVKKQLEEQLRVQHERSLEQLDRFAEDATVTLRTQLVNMCKTITQKIKDGELISKANLNTIRTEIENFRALNFLDDAAVEDEINRLEELVEGKKMNFKTDQEAIAVLNEALNNVLEKASNVSDISSIRGKYFRKVKV